MEDLDDNHHVPTRNQQHFERLEKILVELSTQVFGEMTECTERVFTKVISGLRDKHEDKDWLKTVGDRGPAVLSNLNIVLFDKNPYVSFMKLLTQFFGIHIKLSTEINNAIYMGSLKCVNALSLFYEIQ